MTGSHSFSHVVGTICVSHGDWEPYVMIDRRVTGHGKHGGTGNLDFGGGYLRRERVCLLGFKNVNEPH